MDGKTVASVFGSFTSADKPVRQRKLFRNVDGVGDLSFLSPAVRISVERPVRIHLEVEAFGMHKKVIGRALEMQLRALPKVREFDQNKN